MSCCHSCSRNGWCTDQRFELRNQSTMAPIIELGGDAVLDGDQPQLLEPRRFVLQEPTLLDVRQRRASPQAQRLAQEGHRVDPVRTALRPSDEPSEPGDVERLRRQRHAIAGRHELQYRWRTR